MHRVCGPHVTPAGRPQPPAQGLGPVPEQTPLVMPLAMAAPPDLMQTDRLGLDADRGADASLQV